MKRELGINIVLGVLSLGIIGIILVPTPAPRATQPSAVQNKTSTISLQDFAGHNTITDCWIRINGNVYNITDFISQHPGGPDLILPFCGDSDATTAFATKDGRGTHSPKTEQLLNKLLVGTLSP